MYSHCMYPESASVHSVTWLPGVVQEHVLTLGVVPPHGGFMAMGTVLTAVTDQLEEQQVGGLA